jgi:hypothetical protein
LYRFRPSPDTLEGRVLLHGGGDDEPSAGAPAASQDAATSTAAEVFRPQMGRVVTMTDVTRAHLSRARAHGLIAGQIRRAYVAFGSGLGQAASRLATSGDRAALRADLRALSAGLDARVTQILSTSPRAADSLVPSLQSAIDGPGPNSLVSRLMAAAPASPDATRRSLLDLADASRGRVLAAFHTFTQDPAFGFPGGGTGGGGTGGGTGRISLRVPPAAPAAVAAAPTSNTAINLSWAYVPGATGYVIEQSTDGIDWAEIARVRVGPNNDTYSDTGLTPNTTYFYRVRAANAGGFSDPSPYTAAFTSLAPPNAPAGFVLSPIQDPHHLGLAMHIHPHLTIIINGQQVAIPAYIGLTYPSGASDPNSSFTAATPIHTHDPSGYLHVESTQVYMFTVGDFFNVWSHYAGGQGHPVSDPSVVFNSQDILGHMADATHQITMTVNGKPSALYGNLPLNDPDGTLISEEGNPSNLNIVITYGPSSGS